MPPTGTGRLDSWKEIADYLHRDVRTVMRWEKEKGLPVHRVPGGQRHAVFAYREEIDAWLLGAGAPLEEPAQVSVQDNLRQKPQTPPTGQAGMSAPPAGVGSTRLTTSKSPPYMLGERVPKLKTRRAALGIGLALVLALAAVAAFFWPRPGPADRITFGRNIIHAWDDNGKLAWSYEFPEEMGELVPGESERLVRLVDLDGDGNREVLAVADFRDPSGTGHRFREALYCFSGDGDLLWRYEPELTLSFQGREFTGPWHFYDLLVLPNPGARSVWLAVVHYVWWPSFVVKLDTQGQPTVQFVHPGTLYTLGYLRNASGSYVLAGGVNNELDHSGSLAVLEENQPSGTSPPQEANPAFRCDDCPPGQPSRYFLFPRSELNRLLQIDKSWVGQIFVTADKIEVSTFEVSGNERVIYTLSGEFGLEPVSRAFSDTYWMLHEKLEQEGKIKHAAEDCPERTQPIPVRMWTTKSGWSKVTGLRVASPPPAL